MIEATVDKRYYSLEEGDWDWCVCFFGKCYPFGNDDGGFIAATNAASSFIEDDGVIYYAANDDLKRLEELTGGV